MALVAASLLAVVVLPFLIGYWIGQGPMAALAFAALGVTILIRQVEVGRGGDPIAGLLLWIVVSTALSAGAAYSGGQIRERRRAGP